MRVKLLVNLKIENGSVITAGTIFDDSEKPFPEHVENNKNNKNIFREIPTEVFNKKEPVVKENKPPKEVKAEKPVLAKRTK